MGAHTKPDQPPAKNKLHGASELLLENKIDLTAFPKNLSHPAFAIYNLIYINEKCHPILPENQNPNKIRLSPDGKSDTNPKRKNTAKWYWGVKKENKMKNGKNSRPIATDYFNSTDQYA